MSSKLIFLFWADAVSYLSGVLKHILVLICIGGHTELVLNFGQWANKVWGLGYVNVSQKKKKVLKYFDSKEPSKKNVDRVLSRDLLS